MKKLCLEIPAYDIKDDPTKFQNSDSIIEWNVLKSAIREIKMKCDKLLKDYKKRKAEEKLHNDNANSVKKGKWKDEENLVDILKLKNEINNIDRVNMSEELDDLFVE